MSKNIKVALNFLLDLSTEGMWGELRLKHKTLDSFNTPWQISAYFCFICLMLKCSELSFLIKM